MVRRRDNPRPLCLGKLLMVGEISFVIRDLSWGVLPRVACDIDLFFVFTEVIAVKAGRTLISQPGSFLRARKSRQVRDPFRKGLALAGPRTRNGLGSIWDFCKPSSKLASNHTPRWLFLPGGSRTHSEIGYPRFIPFGRGVTDAAATAS